MSGGPFLRGISSGAFGGLLGTVLMDMVMVLTFLAAGQPADAFFSMVGERLGDGALAGLLLHDLIGLTAGLIFAALVLGVSALRVDGRRKALYLGLAAGALTVPLGCIPLAIWLGQPIPDVIAFSILPHLVWGVTLGWVVGLGLVGGKGR